MLAVANVIFCHSLMAVVYQDVCWRHLSFAAKLAAGWKGGGLQCSGACVSRMMSLTLVLVVCGYTGDIWLRTIRTYVGATSQPPPRGGGGLVCLRACCGAGGGCLCYCGCVPQQLCSWC